MTKANLIISASHWQDVKPEEWPAKYFTPEECADSRDGSIVIHVPTLLAADALRAEMNTPLHVNSWYRTPKHDLSIGGAGVHPTGQGIDFGISGHAAFKMISLASKHGFTGIGVSQRGAHNKRFIHLDTMDGTAKRPRPWVWSY